MKGVPVSAFGVRGQARDDRVLPLQRVVAVLVIAILVLAVLSLYVWPDSTETTFAWTIKPPIMAMAMGSGYLMGIYFFLRVILARRWHTIAPGYLAISAFTIFMLLATLLHLDRFHQGSMQFYLWTVTYIVTPVLVPLLWLLNRPADPLSPTSDDLLLPPLFLRAVQAIGLVFLAVSLLGFIFPDTLIGLFPWKLTPLTARITAGWLSFPAVGGLVLGRERRWSTWRIVVQAAYVGILAFALALPRDWSSIAAANPLTWLMLLMLLGYLVTAPVVYITLERQRVKRMGPVSQPTSG